MSNSTTRKRGGKVTDKKGTRRRKQTGGFFNYISNFLSGKPSEEKLEQSTPIIEQQSPPQIKNGGKRKSQRNKKM